MSDSDRDDIGGHIRRRRRIIFLSVGVLGVLAAGVMFFLLATKVLQVTITPVDADQAAQLQGGAGVAVFGRRLLLYAADGSAVVAAQGFEPKTVAVSQDSENPLRVELKPLPGKISITVNSDTAFLVRIDGKVTSSDRSFEVELEPGVHLVRVEGRDIEPYEQDIEVEGRGRPQAFEFTPQLAASAVQVMLRVAAKPAAARILLDGTAIGTGRFEGSVAGGRRELRIEAEHYQGVARTIELTEEGLDLGTIELQPNPARVALTSSPSGANILVDGRFQGSTPLDFTLPAGKEYQISVRKANLGNAEDVLKPTAGAQIKRHYQLSAVTFRAEVVANMQAAVAVNGQHKGSTPLTLDVATGDRITVSADGQASSPAEVVVQPAGGENRRYAFTLMQPAMLAYEQAEEEVTVFGKVRLRKFPPLRFSFPANAPASSPAGGSGVVEVALSRPFYMATHEVTLEDFRAFVGGGAPSKEAHHPATSMSWNDAVRFCNWLSAKAGLPPAYVSEGGLARLDTASRGFRLPTEVEWLAVASYDVAKREPIGLYPWGRSETIPRAFANVAGREVSEKNPRFLPDHIDNHAATAPVTAYPKNRNGLHGIGGNVSEWVHDYHRNTFGTGGALTDWTGPGHGLDHVVRGASFASHTRSQLRLDFRDHAGHGSGTVGFRVARWIY